MKNRVSTKGSVLDDRALDERSRIQMQGQQQQQDEGSVIMGASIISSHPGLGPMGWASANSELSAGGVGGGDMDGQIIGAGASYNPMATGDSEEENSRAGRMSSSMFVGGETPSISATSGGRDPWNPAEGMCFALGSLI